jgi:uncharacterized protein with HEPN domain
MKKDPRVYLLHIRDALDSIERYTNGGEQVFLADEKTQDAVIYNLAIIGEVVKRLPMSLRKAHASIPWRNIAGTRDIVIHEYNKTEIPRIWNIVEHDLPALRRVVNDMLKLDAA